MQVKRVPRYFKRSNLLGCNEFIQRVSRGLRVELLKNVEKRKNKKHTEVLFQFSKREEFEFYILKSSMFDSLPREILEWIIKCIIYDHLVTKSVIT